MLIMTFTYSNLFFFHEINIINNILMLCIGEILLNEFRLRLKEKYENEQEVK